MYSNPTDDWRQWEDEDKSTGRVKGGELAHIKEAIDLNCKDVQRSIMGDMETNNNIDRYGKL